MEKEFVHPNFHVILVHYPLAFLIVGTLIELFSFLWRKHGFRAAGRWMILLGALMGIPTALSGVYAMKDVAQQNGLGPVQINTSWNAVRSAGTLSNEQWDQISRHLLLECIAVGIAVLVSISWIAFSDRWRERMHLPLVIVLLLGVLLTIAGAWHGGEMVYTFGTGVSTNHATTGPVQPATSATLPATTAATSTGPSDPGPPGLEKVVSMQTLQRYLSPVQMHAIMAGITVAIALASLALSIRKITQNVLPTQLDHIAQALGGAPTAMGSDAPDSLTGMDASNDPTIPPLPAARFWLITFLFSLFTLGGGYFLLATHDKTWSPVELWNGVIKENPRQICHVIAGSLILLLPLVLASLARWAPRQKVLLGFFAFLLLAAVSFQVWVGILLLLDTRAGPLTGFN